MEIRTLNLDGMFIPVPRPEVIFELSKFSGGELHIKLRNNITYEGIDKVIITHRIKNTDDLMAILIAKDALELRGVKSFDLIIPYIPYARQDRKCTEGESFSLKVFANLLNSANLDKVYCLDAHSDVAPALINNCINLPNTQYVEWAVAAITGTHTPELLLISPDAGSNKKANALYSDLKLFKGLIKCDKKRNLEDGSLSGFEVFADDLRGQDCLIVDDICDGGGTFIGLAEELRSKNCGDLYLFVTHGIFSKGISILTDVFERVFTTNSFSDVFTPIPYRMRHPKLEQFKIIL
jgi:ribose-phosphate pyrophosphokinase